MSSAIKPRQATANSQAVWQRMLWKDFRELLPIWLILLAVAGICLLITGELVKARFYDASTVHLCGQTFIAVFCFATGVFLFATESENRTVELLRGLPVRPGKLVHSKLLLGLVGALISACLIAIAANLLVDQLVTGSESFDSSQLTGVRTLVVVPILFFLFGVLAAMLTGSTFYGFVLAGAMVFLSACFSEVFFLDNPSRKPVSETNYWLTIAAASLAVLAIVIWKAENWIEGQVFPQRSRTRRSAKQIATNSISQVSRPRPFPFLFLLWQSFRMARVPMLLYLVVVLLAWIGLTIFFRLIANPGDINSLVVVPIYQAVLFSAALLTLLFGSTVFMKDQQQRSYRFFQQNVERARSFWLARLLPWWIAVFATVLTINLFVAWMFAKSREHLGTTLNVHQNWEFGFAQLMADLMLQYASQTMAFSLLILLAALGVSQLFSMFVRNPIIAVIVALILGMAAVAYGMAVTFLDESLILFFAPIVVSLYFATWFRSKYWLADSQTGTGWFVPVAAIVLTTTAVLVSFVQHRANEYSDVAFDMNNLAAGLGQSSESRLDQLEFGTAASRSETAGLYHQAIGTLDGTVYDPNDKYKMLAWSDRELDEFVENHQPAVDLMLAAAERIGCGPFLDRNDYQKRYQQAGFLRLVMAAATRKLIRDGQHEPAFACLFAYDRLLQRTSMPKSGWLNNDETDFYNLLIQWADLPNQDPKLIQSAINRIEGSRTNQKPTRLETTSRRSTTNAKEELTEWLKQRYGAIFRDLRGEQAVFELIHSLWEIEQGDYLFDGDVSVMDQLPWEEQRTRRLLERQVVNEFWNRFHYGSFDNNRILEFGNLTSLAASVKPYRIPFADQRRAPRRFGAGSVNYYYYLCLDRESVRRYVLLRLALAAYRAEHGSYPDTLQPLAAYFKKHLPKTVGNGRDFAWLPQGMRAKAFIGNPGHPKFVMADRFDDPILLPFAVEDSISISKLVSFHPLDNEGQPAEESELGIELLPVAGFAVSRWPGFNFYLPPATSPNENETSPKQKLP